MAKKIKMFEAVGLCGVITKHGIAVKHKEYNPKNRKHRQLYITHLDGGKIQYS